MQRCNTLTNHDLSLHSCFVILYAEKREREFQRFQSGDAQVINGT
jgi:hypothetical protein